MFKDSLQAQLKRIFRLEKVSFDLPGESQEQEGIFVQVDKALTRLKDGKELARVQGRLHIFANSEKLKYGFFSKALADANPGDTAKLFFFNFEENKGTYRNIVERTLEFIYLFDSQYDPAIGTLEEVNLSFAENLT